MASVAPSAWQPGPTMLCTAALIEENAETKIRPEAPNARSTAIDPEGPGSNTLDAWALNG